MVIVQKSTGSKLGYQVRLSFSIVQHSRDEQLMKNLIYFFGCGSYGARSGYSCGDFIVEKFSDILEKIIPFFDKYPLVGSKRKDYLDFCKVAELMRSKTHLTAEGLEQIRVIKAGMNRGRSSIS